MPPQTFGGYQIISTLGSGGMGMVYRAKDAYGRIVALKVMAPELVTDTGARMRFEREPKMHANHPNIVQIHDSGTVDRVPYFAMQFIEGKSLSRLIAEYGKLTPEQVLPVLKGLASALDSIHKRGIIHRDIKPSNVLVQTSKRWHPYLSDFGVATRVNDHSVPTPSGVRAGTPRYMSPEQAKRQMATPASDIYSLGVLVYEALCGRPPFDSPSDTNVMEMHQRQNPPDMRTFNPALPPNLSNVVTRALSKDPSQRYRSASEFANQFERALTLSGGTPASGSKRTVGVLMALGIMLAAIAVITYVLISSNREAERQSVSAAATSAVATAIANGEIPVDASGNPITDTATLSDTTALSDTEALTDTNAISDTVVIVDTPTATPATPTVRPTRRATVAPTIEPSATSIPATDTPVPAPTATLLNS